MTRLSPLFGGKENHGQVEITGEPSLRFMQQDLFGHCDGLQEGATRCILLRLSPNASGGKRAGPLLPPGLDVDRVKRQGRPATAVYRPLHMASRL